MHEAVDAFVIRMFQISLLILTFVVASYDCAVVPDGSDSGRVGGLRDWMRNMKGRMSNREPVRMSLMGALDMSNLSKMKLPPSVVSMMTGERMFQPIDLANVKFDPASDRGYRMGNWYVIRRRGTNKDESVDDWSEFFDRKDDKWEVMNNGVERVGDYGTIGCVLSEPTKSTMKKVSGEELSTELLNSAL